jgi:hypothetical protein
VPDGKPTAMGRTRAPDRPSRTAQILMSPPGFKQRLAAPVPRPRLHLMRFQGVRAPNADPRVSATSSLPDGLSHSIDPAQSAAPPGAR